MNENPDIRPVAIYLAGPMLDFTGDFHNTDAQTWREGISADLPPNVVLFSPAHCFFGVNETTAPAVDYIERHVINGCDGVLVNLTEDAPAFGSIRDIEFGKAMRKPVAVAGNIKSLMAHDLIVEPTLDEAFTQLLLAIADARNATPLSLFGTPMLFRIERGNNDEPLD